MRFRFPLVWVAFVLALDFSGALVADDSASARQQLPFDRDWKFQLGDAPNASQEPFDDSGWKAVDLPHDWMIEGVPGADPVAMDGPFDKNSPAGNGGAYLNGGVGWYRKTFTVPSALQGSRVSILFDGAYMNSDVYLNGQKLGNRPYGFSSFAYDLTPQLKYGAEQNVLAVRLDVEQPCCRWYSGAGLYRHVWLIQTAPVHVAQWGTYVTTPKAAADGAQVNIVTSVQNDGTDTVDATVTTRILDPSGKEVARATLAHTINAGFPTGTSAEVDANAPAPIAPLGHPPVTFTQSINLPTAKLWSLESPALYHAVSEVSVGGKITDSYTTPFGIRTIEFRKDDGFFLNGQHVQIQGVCDHHDLGCLGSAAYRRGIERQLQILKGMGCNAIRTSHNPPSPELLELCDQMGFLVMDECFDEWKLNKTKLGYGRFFDQWWQKDLQTMLERDRNHPSIVLWSIGNEVTEGFITNGDKVAIQVRDFVHGEDPTRPVTSACQRPYKAVEYGFDKALDIFGVNYQPTMYQHPDVHARETMIGSETASTVDTRGEYGLELGPDGQVRINPKPAGQVSCYDLFHPTWATDAQQEEIALQKAPWISGEFVWTGFDYLGEPTPYGWPSRSSYFGIVDTCGFPKDRYYLYKSVWSKEPVVHILPASWNWAGFEGKAVPVWVYTNADSVELFLNGQSLGEKKFPADCESTTIPEWKGGWGQPGAPAHQAPTLHLAWNVPYAAGTLKAVAKKNGQVVANDEVDTAGEPARIVMEADRSAITTGGQDLAFFKITVVDKDGHVCPDAANEIEFHVQGDAATLAGVDDGDPTNHESFQGSQHKAFHGLALAVLKSSPTATGAVKLSATSEGLAPAETTITVEAPQPAQ